MPPAAGQSYAPAQLARVMVFRTKDVREGEEHKKIMYFWPRAPPDPEPEEGGGGGGAGALALARARAAAAAAAGGAPELTGVRLEDQCRHAGLCEGLINFSRLFEPHRDVESLHTKQFTAVMLHLGGDVWAQLAVTNPKMLRPASGGGGGDDSGGGSSSSSSGAAGAATSGGADNGAPSGDSGTSDGVDVEWKERDVDDRCLREVLKQVAASFRLLHGPADAILLDRGEPALKAALIEFLDELVPSISAARLSLFDSLDGMHFLPVDKNVYLQLQCFVSGIENSFPFVQSCTVLYADHMLWSGVTDSDDLRAIYRLVSRFLSPWLRERAAAAATSAAPTPSQRKQHPPRRPVPAPFFGTAARAPPGGRGWVVPAPASDDDDGGGGGAGGGGDPVDAPRVFLADEDLPSRLVIYQLHHLLCVLILDDDYSDEADDGGDVDEAQGAAVADGDGQEGGDEAVDTRRGVTSSAAAAAAGSAGAGGAVPAPPLYSRAALQQLADVVVGECAFLLPALDGHLEYKTQQQLSAAGTAAEVVAGGMGGGAMGGAPAGIVSPAVSLLDSEPAHYRYIYYNHMNLAVKSTLLQDWQTPYGLWRVNRSLLQRDDEKYRGQQRLANVNEVQSGSVLLPREVVKVLHEMHADFAATSWARGTSGGGSAGGSEGGSKRPTTGRAAAADLSTSATTQDADAPEPGPGHGIQEIMVRTASERWICGRRSEQREFFVVFEAKTAEFLDVVADVRRLADTYFTSIFL